MKRLFLLVLISVACYNLASAQNIMPPMKANFPVLANGTWEMINLYTRGKTPPPPQNSLPSFIFCKGNSWQMQRPGIGESGIYKVVGHKLYLTYGTTGTPSLYNLTWDAKAKTLSMEGTTTVMVIRYHSVSNCN